jgi:hypothetical protein
MSTATEPNDATFCGPDSIGNAILSRLFAEAREHGRATRRVFTEGAVYEVTAVRIAPAAGGSHP